MGRKKNPDPLYWEKRRNRPHAKCYYCAWCHTSAGGQTWREHDGERYHEDCLVKYLGLLAMSPSERISWWQSNGGLVKPQLIVDAEAQFQHEQHLSVREFWLRPNNAVHLTPAAGGSRDDNDTEPQAQVTADR